MISVDQWLQDHYGAEVFRAGLTDLEKFLAPSLQKILQSKIKIITVAGTNGKGETSFRLAQILKEQKKSFKLWTSPHILSVTERFVSETGPISSEDLQNLFYKIEDKKAGKLSYYEFLFSAFVHWAEEDLPEYLILEVGLGGRLDATVLLPAQLVLIPSISRDHQEYLGGRYEQILNEKLGIMDRCQKVICLTSFESRYLIELTHKKIDQRAEYIDLFEQGILTQDHHFAFRNTVLALSGLSFLEKGSSLSREQLFEQGTRLLESKLAGRGEEIVVGEKKITFFGSHNPDGVRKLIQLLKTNNYTFSEVLISFSARDQKDLITQLKLIGLLGKDKVVLTAFSHPKAAPVDLLEELASKEGIRFVKEWPHILQSSNTTCLVTGSYYFVGAVQSYLGQFR
jgi:dihydrofolate synthase/folylpolyglutamate synthase